MKGKCSFAEIFIYCERERGKYKFSLLGIQSIKLMPLFTVYAEKKNKKNMTLEEFS